jgi:uncharacterized membrane protein YedE/YeeE
VPILLLIGNRLLGISANLRHVCAAVAPGRVAFFRYDWKNEGAWNLSFIAGVFAGGFIAAHVLGIPDVAISPDTRVALTRLGIHDFSGLVPREVLGGCTSGHAIAGLADRQLPSLIAVIGFFAGGLATTYWILPWLL